jgi:hypothetical protein
LSWHTVIGAVDVILKKSKRKGSTPNDAEAFSEFFIIYRQLHAIEFVQTNQSD